MTSSNQPADLLPNPEEVLRGLDAEARLPDLEALLTEFNLFDVLGVPRAEIRHSRVIAWLIDPLGSHGLGDAFLRGFLREAIHSASSIEIDVPSPTDIDGWDLSEAVVFRERHNIDILVMDETNGYVCPIENKIDSGEHSNQLSRYLRTVKRTYPDLSPLPVFLTPGGRRPARKADAEQYATLGYGTVAELINQLRSGHVAGTSASVMDFLRQYELTIRRRVMKTPDDIDRLALKIYNDHSEAIDHIIRTRSRLGTIDWGIIESVVTEAAPDLKFFSRSANILTYTCRSLDDVAELRAGESASGRLVVLEFLLFRRSVRLRLMVGSGPQDTRKRIYYLAPTATYSSEEAGQKIGDPEFRWYWKKFLEEEYCNPFEPEETRIKAEKEFLSFYRGDYPVLMNALRTMFGQRRMSFEDSTRPREIE